MELNSSSIPLTAISTKIPQRLAGYQFHPCDYDEYVAHIRHVFKGPRSRAALLHGGIVGRLAREYLAIDMAALGPSSAVTIHRLGFSIESQGVEYWDDGLTDEELGIICGLHHCFTGMYLRSL